MENTGLSSISDSKSQSNESRSSFSGNHTDIPNLNYKKIIQGVVENETQDDTDFLNNNEEDYNPDHDSTYHNTNNDFVCPQQVTVDIKNSNHFLNMKNHSKLLL